MGQQTNSHNSNRSSQESEQKNHRSNIEPQDPQPESGFVDREERMSIRQSSPTNPRVSEKDEDNQEEA